MVLRCLSKEESPLLTALMPVRSAAIKIAGVVVVAYVILLTYLMCDGVLSIRTIGMDVVCFGLLYSLFKDTGMKSSLLSDVHAASVTKRRRCNLQLPTRQKRLAKPRPQTPSPKGDRCPLASGAQFSGVEPLLPWIAQALPQA